MSTDTPPNNSAIPPTIPDSSNYQDNYNQLLKTEILESSVITDNVLTMSNGTITNLQGPVNNLDAVPAGYIQPASTGGILYSLQYNDNGFFNGSVNLLFDSDILTLNGTFTDGLSTIMKSTSGYNIIDDLINPIDDSYIVTKNYANKYMTINKSSITDNNSYIYSPDQLINGYILRSTNVPVLDQTSTAVDIITYLNNSGKTDISFSFYILNQGTSTFSLSGGTGVTIYPTNFVVYPNYILSSTIIVTSSTTVTLSIDNISAETNYISSFFNTSGTTSSFSTQFPYKINDILLAPSISPSVVSSTGYIYTTSNIYSGLIIRNPSANTIDTLTSSIDNCSFVIQNISGFTITLTANGSWTFANITIGANKTGYFWINGSDIITISIV